MELEGYFELSAQPQHELYFSGAIGSCLGEEVHLLPWPGCMQFRIELKLQKDQAQTQPLHASGSLLETQP